LARIDLTSCETSLRDLRALRDFVKKDFVNKDR
jgi:hypothetical protein